jgi:16S rRNA (guanine1516-N2)-methyltransferase
VSTSSVYQLASVDQKLCLTLKNQIGFKPFYIDFYDYLQGSTLGEGGRRLLYKAVKLKGDANPHIIDANGGWARDAFFLAQQGFTVTVIERVEVIFKLLTDARERALAHPELQEIMARMSFIHGDAREFLQQEIHSKVIYLDPMFPARIKSAKVKKDLQILQSLAETSIDDPNELFFLARQKAAERVIVKRPLNAPFLAEVKPDFQYLGKTVRFDVYAALTSK